mgnify:CR=1 FL=1
MDKLLALCIDGLDYKCLDMLDSDKEFDRLKCDEEGKLRHTITIANSLFSEEGKEEEDSEGEGGEYVCAEHDPPGKGKGKGASGDPFEYKKEGTVEGSEAWKLADNPDSCDGDPPSSGSLACSDKITEDIQGDIGDQSPVIQWRER